MAITFYPSQAGGPTGKLPIAYTGHPMHLLWSDLCLIWRQKGRVGGILLPIRPFKLDEFDELYLSSKNVLAIVVHAFLVVAQLSFLLSLFTAFWVPVGAFAIYVTGFLTFNWAICRIFLNGGENSLESTVGMKEGTESKDYWIYLNGVSVGSSWLQANVDRLSHTFGRRIVGVLNPTDGIIFDLIQCMVQRNLCYSTQDIRDAYALIKEELLNEKHQKVVFILHSQGGIEGGLVIDWLLDEIPQDRMQRLEVYTFGNAANHFNNPHRLLASTNKAMQLDVRATKQSKAIRYVEHYANSGDFVAQFGVLNFHGVSNRFMGRVFQSPKSGHLLNMHYLHEMFPLETVNGTLRCKDVSGFMEMELIGDPDQLDEREDLLTSILTSDTQSEIPRKAWVGDINTPISPLVTRTPTSTLSVKPRSKSNGTTQEKEDKPTDEATWRVKHFSRLWAYRNGGSPTEKENFQVPARATF